MKFSLIIFLLTLCLSFYFLFVAQIQLGGDIVEYFGVTESLINHQGVNLTQQDQNNLEISLNPGYFNDPTYYITGRDNYKYPVHFFFYSFLLLPVRLVLKLFPFPELKAFALTNIFILMGSLWLIQYKYLYGNYKKTIFLVTVLLSPLISFISWPGPDLFYSCFLLISAFTFFDKNYWLTSFLIIIASWHSQPLVVLAFFITLIAIFNELKSKKEYKNPQFYLKFLGISLFLAFLTFIPYFYNYWAFSLWSPWIILQDGWTKIYGFGLQNSSFKKLFEQFFDLNIGLFWYVPVIFLLSIFSIVKTGIKDKKVWILFIALILTAFFYQTNPAWHYGTAGFGPGRHGLYLLPFLIYFTVNLLGNNKKTLPIIALVVVSQFLILAQNNFLEPDFTNFHRHTPLARFVLERWPRLYNPTPEIFVDRTNHTDLKYPTSAIYISNGICKKAFILKTDKELLVKTCGSISAKNIIYFDDELAKPANEARFVITTEATLWPFPVACEPWYYPTTEHPYLCLRTKEEVMYYTGVWDNNRIKKLQDFPDTGIWKITFADPVNIKVPPGYTIQYNSFEGKYVDY